MNSSDGAWPRSKIPAKSSLIQTPVTMERKSARKHCFRAITYDSARHVSKPGSFSPQEPPAPRKQGRTETTSKIGCVPNRNSSRITRNGEVPTNTHDTLKCCQSSERLIL